MESNIKVDMSGHMLSVWEYGVPICAGKSAVLR
jgi:hypothetical protein